MEIKLLDCTLRDGGYVNDWNFGRDNLVWMFQKLQKSNIDVIELGYMRDYDVYNPDRAVFPDTKSFNVLFSNKKPDSIISAMIDYGDCKIENISDKKDSIIDILRITFRKKNIDDALAYCKQVKEKGYKIFLQPVSITSYSDKEMLDLIEKINDLKPVALSIVDSYGLMHEEKVMRYFYLMDNNLDKEIAIAYHSHNNFQLAYSNSIKLLNSTRNRDLYFDASLYGMGKSAGNCNTELLAMYLNKNFDKKYDIDEILDIIDIQILNLFKQYMWGYKLPFYVSALNDCHPNYVNYLLEKNMITVKEINKIVSKINAEKRLVFDKEYIEELYLNYQRKKVDDAEILKLLKNKISNTTILLLGSGSSISKEYEKIKSFIINEKPLVFSVNHINNFFNSDYIFLSNAKRFKQFETKLQDVRKNNEIIITSNIEDKDNIANYKLNWEYLASTDTIVGASSLYLLINLLIKLNINKVVLAGFDGFSKYTSNYYDKSFEFYNQSTNVSEIQKEIDAQLHNFQKYIYIEFLTKSKYSLKKGENINV